MSEQPTEPTERVGFRDIYNAVGDSEKRVKEHITLVLLPLTGTIADHEKRLRSIEEQGSDEARLALARATAVELRVTAVEAWKNDLTSAGIERRRLGDLSKRAIIGIMLGSNAVLGVIVAIANILTDHAK